MPKDEPENGDRIDKNLPPDVKAFLDNVIQGSVMRFDVLRFFNHNPYAILTITDLSVWMSREEKPLADALQQLSRLEYLAQSFASSAYVLTKDLDKQRKLEAFFDYLEDHPELVQGIRRTIYPGGEAE